MSLTIVKKVNENYKKYLHIVFENDNYIPAFLNAANQKILKNNEDFKNFKAKQGEKLELGFSQDDKSISLIILSLGKKEDYNDNILRENLYATLKNLNSLVLISTSDKDLENFGVIAEVVEHRNYSFDKYLSEKDTKKLEAHLLSSKKKPANCEELELAKIANIVKDLINEHSEIMNPKFLAETVKKLGKEYGFDVKILDEKQAEKLGMKAYLSVARAAHHRPNVIVMTYQGDKKSKYKFGLVGKGLTYDTGGLSLKPTDSMLHMKDDMGGAATMIGAMCAIAKMNVKKNVTAVVAACENSIGPNAYRPGDVVETMNGKTIFVNNTDAEGRVTLADALTYIIRNEKVDEIIDAATLTGAMLIALGEDITGVFTNDRDFAKEFIQASEKWIENFWEMPMNDSFKRYIKSDIADLQNSGGRMAGSITAAKFLEEFVEGKKWMHLDIAGTAFSSGSSYYKAGATGEVFRTIYSYIKASKK